MDSLCSFFLPRSSGGSSWDKDSIQYGSKQGEKCQNNSVADVLNQLQQVTLFPEQIAALKEILSTLLVQQNHVHGTLDESDYRNVMEDFYRKIDHDSSKQLLGKAGIELTTAKVKVEAFCIWLGIEDDCQQALSSDSSTRLKEPFSDSSLVTSKTSTLSAAGDRISIIHTANSWLGGGMYIAETRGMIVYDLVLANVEQDIKIRAFSEAGERISDCTLSKVNARIENKTANMNCWQFCLLVYIQCGILDWKLVGEMYKEIDRLWNFSGADMRVSVPLALKSAETAIVDFNSPKSSPNWGDLIFFGRNNRHDIYHCEIFQNVDKESGTFSTIGIFGWPVREVKRTLSDLKGSTSFVRMEEVKDNVLNFLSLYKLQDVDLLGVNLRKADLPWV